MPTTSQQLSVAYKKVALQVAEIGLTADFPYFVSPDSPNTVYGSQVILNDTDIPATAPTTNLVNGSMFDSTGTLTTDVSEAIVQYNESLIDAFPGSNNDSYSLSTFTGIILPFVYGDGTYAPMFSANSLNGQPIDFGEGDYVFFPEAGVLTFFNGKPVTVTNNQIGIRYWTYVGSTASNVRSGSPLTTQNYILDINNQPDAAVWSTSTQTWSITHNLNSNNLFYKLRIGSNTSAPIVVETSSNELTLTILGSLDKVNDTVTYPDDVELIINKF